MAISTHSAYCTRQARSEYRPAASPLCQTIAHAASSADTLNTAGSPAAREALDRLKRVYALLKDFGLEKYVSFDLGTVKDLSYYSGVVFTGLTRSIGSPILSGGRYDNLADDFGRHVPAVGFAMGLKRILIALERQGALRPAAPRADVVIFSEEGAETKAYQAYLELTAAGRRVDLAAGDAKEAETLKNAGMVVLKATKKGVEKI